MMVYLKWLAIVVLSLALGVLTVQYLTVHPIRMSWYLLAAMHRVLCPRRCPGSGFQGKDTTGGNPSGPGASSRPAIWSRPGPSWPEKIRGPFPN